MLLVLGPADIVSICYLAMGPCPRTWSFGWLASVMVPSGLVFQSTLGLKSFNISVHSTLGSYENVDS